MNANVNHIILLENQFRSTQGLVHSTSKSLFKEMFFLLRGREWGWAGHLTNYHRTHPIKDQLLSSGCLAGISPAVYRSTSDADVFHAVLA